MQWLKMMTTPLVHESVDWEFAWLRGPPTVLYQLTQASGTCQGVLSLRAGQYGPEHWGRLLSPSESLVKVCSRVAGRFQVQPEGKSPCANDFLVSACIILATVPWPKESHDQSQRPCGREGTTESCEIRELVDLWLFVPCINNWQKKLTASSQRIDHLWKLFICTSDQRNAH